MLRLLIPLVDNGGAPLAARHAALLFGERCVEAVDLLEVLEPVEYGRETAFHASSALLWRERRAMLAALARTRAILDEAGVPYEWHRVTGDAAHMIAAQAAQRRTSMVLFDASHLHFLRRAWMLIKLWRLSPTPVTLLH